MVDVLKMGGTLMKSGDLRADVDPHITTLASVLREPKGVEGWCAGNQCQSVTAFL
jgi:hypothetical protein